MIGYPNMKKKGVITISRLAMGKHFHLIKLESTGSFQVFRDSPSNGMILELLDNKMNGWLKSLAFE